ncbi:MAG TPA: stage III sporulation protein AC [Pseudogracilibacillus sp.]|nr:stage III sporulation protein AC [Pseudogracilibacillus sp.]
MLLDTTILFQIAGIGIVTALIHTVLKQLGKEDIAQFISLLGFVIVLLIVIHHLSRLFQQIKTVFLLQGL